MNIWQITTNGTVVVQNVSHAIAWDILQLLETTYNLPDLQITLMAG
jgi:hypothetical protein